MAGRKVDTPADTSAPAPARRPPTATRSGATGPADAATDLASFLDNVPDLAFPPPPPPPAPSPLLARPPQRALASASESAPASPRLGSPPAARQPAAPRQPEAARQPAAARQSEAARQPAAARQQEAKSNAMVAAPPPGRNPPPRGDASPARNAAPLASPRSGGGRELDDDDPFGLSSHGAALELDVPAPSTVSRMAPRSHTSGTMNAVASSRSTSGASPSPGSRGGAMAHSGLSIATTAPMTPARPFAVPAGKKATSARLDPHDVDPYDARALGDYGEAPSGLFAAPLYALRVVLRQRDLRRALSRCRLESERAEAKVEAALVGFGERARTLLQSTSGHHRMLEDVTAAEQLARDRDGKLAGEMDAYRGRAATVDARIAELEAQLAAARDEERLALEGVARAEAARDRADAKLRRREIEARNSAGAAPQSSAGRDARRDTGKRG